MTPADPFTDLPPAKLLVTPEEAAAMLSVSRTTVYHLMAASELPSVQIASCRRIPVAALEHFVQDLLAAQAEGDCHG